MESVIKSTSFNFFFPAINLYSERPGYNILNASSSDCYPSDSFWSPNQRHWSPLLLWVTYMVRIYLLYLQFLLSFAMESTKTHGQKFCWSDKTCQQVSQFAPCCTADCVINDSKVPSSVYCLLGTSTSFELC